MQLPVLWHGKNCVPDSNAIVAYLTNTYPQEMALFTPADPHRCALWSWSPPLSHSHGGVCTTSAFLFPTRTFCYLYFFGWPSRQPILFW